MGQAESSEAGLSKLREAFARDQCTVERTWQFRQGLICVARTNAANYVDYDLDAAETARRILRKEGPLKRVVYVRGSPYEMGYMIGRLFPDQIEAVCTTYLHHMAPQFISEAFDMAMMAAPLMYQSVYEVLLTTITGLLVQGSAKAFWAAHARGDVPQRYVDEMRGLADGASSVSLVSAVTLDRIIAANFGLDYLMMLMLSGRLLRRVKQEWNQLPAELRAQVQFNEAFLGIPDMCNAFMASKSATADQGIFLARDFQFANAHTYNRNCTLMVRVPTEPGRLAHLDVTMPGMVGAVTSLNAQGVALGLNMVRSGAVDEERLGLGVLLTTRELMETSRNVGDCETVLKGLHRGVPWLIYAIDALGDMRVFETLATRWDTPETLTPERWVQNTELRALLPPVSDLQAWKPQGAEKGVWPRQGLCLNKLDEQLRQWSQPLVQAVGHPELADPARWAPGGFLYNSWEDERTGVQAVSNHYFPPWRALGPDIAVVNNSFLYPPLRLTQMTWTATMAERQGVGNQWRYDSMVSQLQALYGKLDFQACKEIITFLSPWKQPRYPQNAPVYRQAIPQLSEVFHKGAPPAIHEPAVIMAGSISVVDVRRMRIENRSGYWGNEFYALTLSYYLE